VESFNFELKLISDVDRVANRGVAPLRKLEAQSKKTQEALNFHKPLERVEQQLARLNRDPAGFVKMKKAQKELAEQQKKLLEGAGLARGEGFLSAMTSKMSFTKLASAAAVGDIVGEGIMKAGESLFELAHKFADVIKEGLEHAFEEAGKQQVLRVGERLSLRGGAGEFREDVNRFSKLTGFDDDNIRQMLLPMRRAGMGQQGVRSAFAAASDVAAGEGRGGDQGRVQELLSGFEHIFLKGGVQERLLPGLGVAVKPFYADLAKQLHVSADVAKKKRAEEGKVDPQLSAQHHLPRHREEAGRQARHRRDRILQDVRGAHGARQEPAERVSQEPSVDSPNFQKASDMMAGLLEKLDPESPRDGASMGALESMFDKITSAIGDPADAADKIADGLDRAISVADQLLPDLKAIGGAMLDAAEMAAKWVTNIRLAQAYLMHDTATVDRINQEESSRQLERNVQVFSKQKSKQEDARNAGTYAGRLAGGMDPMMAAVMYAGDRDSSQRANTKAIQIMVSPGAVVVHGAGDGEDTGKEAGEKLHGHVVRELTRAAQQGGG
jgi:hypothetical protein